MVKYNLVNGSKIIEFLTYAQAENYALANDISVNSIAEVSEIPQNPIASLIDAKLKQFQESAPTLVRELYVSNTLAGITTAQSDQMFDDYQDVLMRIKEGAFPTALYRLSTKQPSGFVTQELIDAWVLKIQGYMV